MFDELLDFIGVSSVDPSADIRIRCTGTIKEAPHRFFMGPKFHWMSSLFHRNASTMPHHLFACQAESEMRSHSLFACQAFPESDRVMCGVPSQFASIVSRQMPICINPSQCALILACQIWFTSRGNSIHRTLKMNVHFMQATQEKYLRCSLHISSQCQIVQQMSIRASAYARQVADKQCDTSYLASYRN